MGFDKTVIPKVMNAILTRTYAYLREEIGITVEQIPPVLASVDTLALRDITTIIGVNSRFSMLIAFSFELSLIERLFAVEMAGIEIAEDERLLYQREAAAEIVNILIGHSTADLEADGETIALSPPVVIQDGNSIHRPKNAVFAHISIPTDFGNFDIDFIGPRELFDERLNVRTQLEPE